MSIPKSSEGGRFRLHHTRRHMNAVDVGERGEAKHNLGSCKPTSILPSKPVTMTSGPTPLGENLRGQHLKFTGSLSCGEVRGCETDNPQVHPPSYEGTSESTSARSLQEKAPKYVDSREALQLLSLSVSERGQTSSAGVWGEAKRQTGQQMIVCAAVVGQQNNPLYLQSFIGEDDTLKFHYIVHCALDVIEEKVTVQSKGGAGGLLNETYLGLLYPTEDYSVYGYVSNTRVKLVLVLDDADVKDADVRMVFRRFHAAYVDSACNPFHTPGQRLTSSVFDSRVRAALQLG